MKIVSLTLENFRRYAKETIDFPEGLIGIVGRNGVGKTTLVEALGWCLYGNDAARSGKEDIKRSESIDKTECKVTAELILGSDAIRIERSLRGKNSSASASLFLNGEPKVHGMKAVSDYITSRIGMDRVAFFTSIFAKQKELAALSAENGSERKRIILRLLHIDKIDAVLSLIRFDIKTTKNVLDGMQMTLENMDDLQNELERLEKERSLLSDKIEKIKTDVKTLKELLEIEQQNFAKIEQKYKEYQQINREIAALNGLIIGAKNEKNHAESDLALSVESEQKLTEIKPQLIKFDEIKNEKHALDLLQIKYTTKTSLQKQYKDYEEQIAIKSNKNQRLVEQLKSYGGINEKLEQITQKLALLQENYDEKRGEESGIQSTIREKSGQKDALQQEFHEIQSLGDQSVCPKCKRPLGEHIKELSKQYVAQIEQLQNSINSYVKKKSDLSDEIKIILNNKKLEQSHESTIRQQINEFTALQAKLDEAEQNLTYLKTQQSKTATDLEKYSDIQYDKNRHLLIINEFERLENINKIVIGLQEKIKNIPILQERIESINNNIFKMNGEVSSYNKQLENIGFSEEQYENAKKSKSQIESNFHEKRETLVKYEQNLIKSEDDVSQQKQAIGKRNEQEETKKELECKTNFLQVLDSIMVEFKMDLISRIKPQLSSRTSELFNQMTNGKYPSIDLDEDYTIMINDRGHNYQIARFSGGEVDLVNLCLRIAISQELSQRAGRSRTQFIVLDEIFGSQDEERKANILRALQNLTSQFRQIILITHVEDVKESLPYVLNIKDGTDNTVSVEIEGDFPTHK